ncbi:MAG TPA: hypothetical protein DEO86_19270 [Colwellia sp.]|nr:hypothetical protein [Colwellia sp.]
MRGKVVVNKTSNSVRGWRRVITRGRFCPLRSCIKDYIIGKAQKHIQLECLWVNPDCGLKARVWAETSLR